MSVCSSNPTGTNAALTDPMAELRSWLLVKASFKENDCNIICKLFVEKSIFSVDDIVYYLKKNNTSIFSGLNLRHADTIVDALVQHELVSKDCEAIQAYLPRNTPSAAAPPSAQTATAASASPSPIKPETR
jgi:hypothetical protein